MSIPPWRIGDLTIEEFWQAIAQFEYEQQQQERQ